MEWILHKYWNTGNIGNTENTGNTGNTENTGNTGNTGNTENTGNTATLQPLLHTQVPRLRLRYTPRNE